MGRWGAFFWPFFVEIPGQDSLAGQGIRTVQEATLDLRWARSPIANCQRSANAVNFRKPFRLFHVERLLRE